MTRDTQGRFTVDVSPLVSALTSSKPDTLASLLTENHRQQGEARAKATRAHTDRPIQSWDLHSYKPPRISSRARRNIQRPEHHEPETMGVAPYHPPAGIN
jgi:hypothetical protein